MTNRAETHPAASLDTKQRLEFVHTGFYSLHQYRCVHAYRCSSYSFVVVIVKGIADEITGSMTFGSAARLLRLCTLSVDSLNFITSFDILASISEYLQIVDVESSEGPLIVSTSGKCFKIRQLHN